MKSISKILIFLFLFMFSTPSIVHGQGAMKGFINLNFPDNSLDVKDGIISKSWDNVTSYQNITEFGEQGKVYFANNRTHIFAKLEIDASLPWVAIEWNSDPSNFMEKGNDVWTVYLDDTDKTFEVKDATMDGTDIPIEDPNNDIYAECVFEDNIATVEIVRPYIGADVTDVQFSNNTIYKLTFASYDAHYEVDNQYYVNLLWVNMTLYGPPIIEEPVIIDNSFDWTGLKMNILYGVLAFTGAFIATHFLIRGIFRPLHHPSRIVDANYKNPTFGDRWNQIKTIGKGIRKTAKKSTVKKEVKH